jgi:hypothetical protein
VSSETEEWAAFKERNMIPILKAPNEEENFELGDGYYRVSCWWFISFVSSLLGRARRVW